MGTITRGSRELHRNRDIGSAAAAGRHGVHISSKEVECYGTDRVAHRRQSRRLPHTGP
jgi:hypothetical protein